MTREDWNLVICLVVLGAMALVACDLVIRMYWW